MKIIVQNLYYELTLFNHLYKCEIMLIWFHQEEKLVHYGTGSKVYSHRAAW